MTMKPGKQEIPCLNLPSRLFQSGFEDFRTRKSYFDESDNEDVNQTRNNLREFLVFNLRSNLPHKFDSKTPNLLALAYYPLQIAAAQWMSYVELMSHSIKQYEYSTETIPAREQLAKLNSDLRDLQSWGRRVMSTKDKLRGIIASIQFQRVTDTTTEKIVTQLVDDFQHILQKVDAYGKRLESTVLIVISMIQIADARFSFMETTHIMRLTYLALIFVPLGYVASLLSMNESIAPRVGSIFGLYFLVAIPVTILVVLVARGTLDPHLHSLYSKFSHPQRIITGKTTSEFSTQQWRR